MASNTPTTSSRRTITTTSFDFLNGAYKRSANARLAALAAIGVVLTAAMLVFLYGANHMLMASTARTQADQAFEERLQASGELTRVSSSGGLSEEDMLKHLGNRSVKALELLEKTPSLTLLLQDLQRVTPSGMGVTSVTLGSAQQQQNSGGSAGTGTPTSVTVTASAADYAMIKPWETALRGITYIRPESTTWSNAGSGEGIVITTTAKIDTSVPSYRYEQLRSEIGEFQSYAEVEDGKKSSNDEESAE